MPMTNDRFTDDLLNALDTVDKAWRPPTTANIDMA
jgi:hypothetical protein